MDRDVVERARSGDQEAFADLVHQVSDTLLGVARRILRDPGLAEDVLQNALLTIWRKLPHPHQVQQPTFSPDGKRIAYAIGGGDHSNSVWLMDADGSDAHQVVSNETNEWPGHVRGLAWSPAGDRIALGLGGKIYSFATDGSDFTQIAGGDTTCGPADPCAVKLPRSAESPYWSPDGSQIAYTTGCVEGAGAANRDGCNLATADADGSNVLTFGFGASGPWHLGTLESGAGG